MAETEAQFHTVEALSHDPLDSEKFDPDGMGYCVSGGGYKAAAYHLGGFVRLNELGLLPKIKRIASVSGGSIAAGLLASRWGKLDFDANHVAENFHEEVVQPLKDFLTEINLDIYAGVGGILDPFHTAAEKVSGGYRKHLVGDMTLQDLPDEASAPRFVFLSTNYELNSMWRFSKAYAADYRVGMIDAPRFRLADIVAASSAFPPFFCPLTLDLSEYTVKAVKGADRNGGDFIKRALLCDGGIYDNMGLEPIWKRYGRLLVSNAGDPMKESVHSTKWDIQRVIGMIHRQAENNRVRHLMEMAKRKVRSVAYWPLRNDSTDYENKPDLPPLSSTEVEAAQDEDVRLWSLGEKAFNRLVRHGYYLADCATRSYLPGLPVPLPASKYPV